MKLYHRSLAGALIFLSSLGFVGKISASPGAMGFLTSPSTVVTGNASSWMEVASDWDGISKISLPNPPYPLGDSCAIPNILCFDTIKTWQQNDTFKLVFSIYDQTAQLIPGSNNVFGDQIIIQIDPNNSGHQPGASQELEHGGTPYTKDYRFEVVLNHDGVVPLLTGYKTPASKLGKWNWGALNVDTFATATYANNHYTVQIKIAKSKIGNPGGNFGLALALINDLGHSHNGQAVEELSATHFPNTMVLAQGDEPGLISTVLDTGAWVDPRQWGTGYVSEVASQLTFTHSPSYYWSDAIKLSQCQIKNWKDVGASGADNWNQDAVPGWYQYNSNNPCWMRIWLKPDKPNSGVMMCRFLTVWGRANIGGTQDWFVARLTEPIAFDSAAPVNFVWDKVPNQSFTDHPCFRAHIITQTITPAESTSIVGMTTDAQLQQVETNYGCIDQGPYTAQMNFTALHMNTSCSKTNPNDKCTLFENKSSFPSFSLVGDCYAQSSQTDVITHGKDTVVPPKKPAFIRILAEGFGIADPDKPPYTYIQRLGGIGWLIPTEDVPAGKSINLKFDLTNPSIVGLNMAKKPYIPIKSPRRIVFVSVKVDASPGVKIPTISIDKNAVTLEPGQTVQATVGVVMPSASGLPWWVILILILLVIIIYIIKKATGKP